MDSKPHDYLDFDDTEIAFNYLSDRELLNMARLFRLMNNKTLVSIGSMITPLAIRLNIPFVKYFVKKTIFKQFVGGESLLDTQDVITRLKKYNTLTLLDYGAEAKTTDEDIDAVVNEAVKAIEMAASNESVPLISTKITGLADNELLVKIQKGEELSPVEINEKSKLERRLDIICKRAHELKVGVMVDAEESWMQDAIDGLVESAMEEFNTKSIIVYNTYQLYRNDKYADLITAHEKAQKGNYLLGAKLVRGAYMDKEREEAPHYGLPVRINATKELTDLEFNKSLEYCAKHFDEISSVCASHNTKSNLLFAALIENHKLDRTHPHLNFCQLYGMSDNITFNLAKSGYNVAKYVPYGTLDEVVPYLLRRASENTAITDDISRELRFIYRELRRRGIK